MLSRKQKKKTDHDAATAEVAARREAQLSAVTETLTRREAEKAAPTIRHAPGKTADAGVSGGAAAGCGKKRANVGIAD